MGNHVESPVADWPTKRAWVDYAFDELAAAGYSVSSAYTMVKDKNKVNFSYRDNLWHGSDLLATGVASFGHASGVHYQNEPDWAGYVGRLEKGELPLYRGMKPDRAPVARARDDLATQDGRARRWLIFATSSASTSSTHWRDAWQHFHDEGFSNFDAEQVTLSRGAACCASTGCCRPSSSPSIAACGTRKLRRFARPRAGS